MFTDRDLELWQKSLSGKGTTFEIERKDLEGLLERLQAAEKAVSFAEESIYGHYDPYKDDCTDCDTFLTPCKPWCSNPKFHTSFQEWRKISGKVN